MTPKQERRFQKICGDMAALINELREGENPEAVLFLEDGTPALYDWPNDELDRPADALAVGSYWPGSGGGGR